MKRMGQLLGVLASLLLIMSTAAHGQILWKGVGHVPEAYRVDWSPAGLLPETPTVADHLFDVTQQSGITVDQKLENAILEAMEATANGTNGQVAIVYFPPGTYRLSHPISLNPHHSNIIFQGTGSTKTSLDADFGSGYGNVFDIRGWPGAGFESWAGIPKGSKTIQLTDSHGFSAGDWIHYYDSSGQYKEQISQLVGFEQSDVGPIGLLREEASDTYGSIWSPVKATRIQPVMNVGIEDLRIRRLDEEKPAETSYAHGINIRMEYAVNCWVKGVELSNAARYHVGISRSAHIEISGCYVHDANHHGGGGYGYGVSLGTAACQCLIENNIFRKLRHSMIVGSGANTNVFTYNYSREGRATWNGIPYTDSDLNLHGRRPYANLYEQNYVQEIEADDTHGDNGPYNVFLRNKVYERSEIDLWNIPHTGFLGNDLRSKTSFDLHGRTSFSAEFYGKLVYGGSDYDTAPKLGHEASSRNPSEKDLARLEDISYFYSKRPDFVIGGYTFPSMGPRAVGGWSTTGSIPARERYGQTPKTYLENPTGYAALLNPGFEEELDFWGTYGDGFVDASSQNVYEGAFSASIEREAPTDRYFGLYQENIAVEPNTEYRLSAWVKTQALSGYAAAGLGVWSSDPAFNHHQDFGYIRGESDWTQITGAWTSRPDEHTIQVVLFGGPDFVGTAYFDGLVLEEVLPRNRGFERGLRYWAPYGDGLAYETVEGGVEGAYCASIARDQNAGDYFGLVQRGIPCRPNTTYRLTLWVKTEADTGWVAAALGNWGDPNTHEDFGYIQGDSDWTEISGVWASEWDETSLDIRLFGSEDFSGRAFFDDLLLEEIGEDPHEVTLRGPSILGYKQSGTFTATVTGGSGDYEYEWSRQYDGSTTWEPLYSQKETQTLTMLGRGFTVRVDVYDVVTDQEASATGHVACDDEPGGTAF